MWRYHLFSLLSQSWTNLLAALSSSTLSVLVLSCAIPTLVFIAILAYNVRKAHKSGQEMKAALTGTSVPTMIAGGITVFAWLCLFGWSVANTIYRDHQSLVSANNVANMSLVQRDSTTTDLRRQVEELGKRKLAFRDQCWMQNITLAAPRNLPAAMSASETVIFCNTERKAPLVMFIDYDKPPLFLGGAAFPQERQFSAMESFKEKQVFVKLDSPSIMPYQIFIVTVYGSDEKPPLATKINIKPINPEH